MDRSKYFMTTLEVNSEIKSRNWYYALTTHKNTEISLWSPITIGKITDSCHCSIHVKLAF